MLDLDKIIVKENFIQIETRFLRIIIAFILLLSVSMNLFEEAEASEKRCGWFQNPTPANAWLKDKDGLWVIGIQGGHQAEGDWPDFEDKDWISTNGAYGYGCACLEVKTDKAKNVIEIINSQVKPIKVCQKDKSLIE